MDEIDRQIVALLRQDARRSFQSIGLRVSLSAPAVKRRVDRLEADGVVRGYTALVDPGRFGWGTHAFVALFFVTIGTLINPAAVVDNVGLLATLIGLIVLGKFVVWTAVVRLFAYPLTTAALVGVGLTQIGEFSFILVQVARTAGLVGDDVYNATLASSLLTILINAALVRYVPAWLRALETARPVPG